MAIARKKHKKLKAALVKSLEEARAELSDEDDRDVVLYLIREGMARHLESYVVAHRQQVVVAGEDWWDKYAHSLNALSTAREKTAEDLAKVLAGLGYEC